MVYIFSNKIKSDQFTFPIFKGFIPFTSDIDFALKITEHEGLFDFFFKNPIVGLDVVFGFPDDSYEFHTRNKDFRYDLFFVYNLNSTYQYYTYHKTFMKHKQLLPHFDDLCSAELIDVKVMVPCDVVNYLTYMYGSIDDWKIPKTENFTWPYLNLNEGTKWSNSRKNNAVKLYGPNGFKGYLQSPY